MKLYRIIYEICMWTQQPIKIWAVDEEDAIEKGKKTLIMAGHEKWEFVSLTQVAKDMKKEVCNALSEQ